MEKTRSPRGTPSHFSEESRNRIIERIRSGEFKSPREVRETFNVSKSTVGIWARKAGFRFATFREMEGPVRTCKDGNMGTEGREEPREKRKDRPFVEPDPGVESFRTEREALKYYKLRAEYLENLYLLADSPTDVKKKALRLLEERVRERMREERT